MKKLNLKTWSILIITLVIGLGCEDLDKSPLPVVKDGAFITLTPSNLILDVTDLENTAITGTLKDPVGNVAAYNLQVRHTPNGGDSSGWVDVYSTTTFPAEMSVNLNDLGNALGLQLADFSPGDRFDFNASTTDLDGNVTTYSDLNIDLQGEVGQLQSYQFVSFISCPFNQAEAIGTYTISDPDGFALNGVTTFEVIAGDASNEIIMINPFGGNEMYDIVIQVNSATGIATIEEQFGFSTLEQCCAGFEATRILTVPGDNSFVFSCAGIIQLTLNTRITQIGTGGQFTFGTLSYGGTKI